MPTTADPIIPIGTTTGAIGKKEKARSTPPGFFVAVKTRATTRTVRDSVRYGRFPAS